jgi:hypothetical protein
MVGVTLTGAPAKAAGLSLGDSALVPCGTAEYHRGAVLHPQNRQAEDASQHSGVAQQTSAFLTLHRLGVFIIHEFPGDFLLARELPPYPTATWPLGLKLR